MRAFKLGEVRINLDHVIFYMPVGNDAGEGGKPVVNLKMVDSPAPIVVSFSTEERRDERIRELDELFFGALPHGPGSR